MYEGKKTYRITLEPYEGMHTELMAIMENKLVQFYEENRLGFLSANVPNLKRVELSDKQKDNLEATLRPFFPKSLEFEEI